MCLIYSYLRKIRVYPICWLANQGYWRTEHSCFYFHEWEQLEERTYLVIEEKGHKMGKITREAVKNFTYVAAKRNE